jgi:hypothetical protein
MVDVSFALDSNLPQLVPGTGLVFVPSEPHLCQLEQDRSFPCSSLQCFNQVLDHEGWLMVTMDHSTCHEIPIKCIPIENIQVCCLWLKSLILTGYPDILRQT